MPKESYISPWLDVKIGSYKWGHAGKKIRFFSQLVGRKGPRGPGFKDPSVCFPGINFKHFTRILESLNPSFRSTLFEKIQTPKHKG
jgi:hypothetical protein